MQLQNAGPHALVVVDNVEVAATTSQDLRDAPRVGQRFAKARTHHDGELGDVGERRELGTRGNAKGVGVAVEIESPNGREAHALIQFGPRRTGEDLDAVTQGDELTGQVPGVHTLAAAARIAPVDEERDAVLSWFGRSCRDVRR